MKRKISILLILVLVVSLVNVFGLSGVLQAAPEKTPTNIALASNGTTVEVSAPNQWAEENGFGIAKVNDGDTTNLFFSESGPTVESKEIMVTMNFQEEYKVNKVNLYAHADGGFPVDFTLEAYTADGWKVVNTQTGYSAILGKNEFTFEEVTCSAFRIVSTKNGELANKQSPEYAVFLSEFEVYGVAVYDNVALASNGTTVEVSAPNQWAEENGFGIAKVNDGDATNLFFSEAGPTVENKQIIVTMTFQQAYDVNKVRLYAHADGGFPVDFTLEAYTKEGWKVVSTQTGYSAVLGKNEFAFNATTCSAFRLVSTKNGELANKQSPEYAVFLSEFEIYGTEPIETKNNIALASNGTSAEVSASNQWAEENGFGIERINDGNTDNLFFSESGPDVENKEITVTMTFQQNYKVDKAVLFAHPDGGFPVDFKLEAYTAEGWKAVSTQVGYVATLGKNEFSFNAVDCSALRLVSTKNGELANKPSAEYAVFLSEFEIYGEETDSDIPAPSDKQEPNPPTPPVQTAYNVASKDNGGVPSTNYPSSWGEGAGYGIANLNDGKTDGPFFVSAVHADYEKVPMKVAVGFNGTYKISQVKLYASQDGAFPVNFVIEVYTEGSWKTVRTENNYQAKAGWNEFDFEAIDCTAVRVHTSQNGKSNTEDKYGIYLGEFEAYGVVSDMTMPAAPKEKQETQKNEEPVNTHDNVALASNGTVAHVSHPSGWGEENEYGKANLNDGLIAPRYFITDNGNQQNMEMKIALHFKTTYKVNKINLYATQDGGFPVDFTLQAYTAEGWKTVVTKTGYKAKTGWQTYEFGDVDCSAVRLVSTKIGVSATTGAYLIYLGEFEVYGVKSSVSVPAAPVEKPVTSGTTSGNAAGGANKGFTYDAEKNIALNVPATARTEYPQYGAGVVNVNDGNLNNFWSCNMFESAKGTAEWVELNLLDNYWIDTVTLYARDFGWGFPIDFTISVFYDDEWKEVVRKTGYTCSEAAGVSEHVFTFPKVVGNKIRIEGTFFNKADGEYGMQLMEVAAYGEKAIGDYVLPNTNIVGSATGVTSSSALEDFGYFTKFLTDGDLETAFSSKQYPTADNKEWIELDFKRSLKMGELQLKPAWAGIGFPTDFIVEVLENDEWVTVLTVTGYERPDNEAWQKFVFDKQHDATKLRITATKLGEDFGQYSFKLNEIRVYPFATEGENEGAVEVVNYKRVKFDTAEKVTTRKSVPVGLFVAGGALVVFAVLLGVLYYIVISKKLKRNQNV